MNGIKGYISIRAIPENAEKPFDPRRKATEGGGGYDLR